MLPIVTGAPVNSACSEGVYVHVVKTLRWCRQRDRLLNKFGHASLLCLWSGLLRYSNVLLESARTAAALAEPHTRIVSVEAS